MSEVLAAVSGEVTREDSRLALLLDNDLFFAVRVTETLKRLGYTTRTLRRLDAFVAALAELDAAGTPPTLALVNISARGLDWRAGIAAARQAGAPVIAFGAHVETDAQDDARRAGATSVIPHSRLVNDLPNVVERALRRAARAAAGDAGAQDTEVRAHDSSGGATTRASHHAASVEEAEPA